MICLKSQWTDDVQPCSRLLPVSGQPMFRQMFRIALKLAVTNNRPSNFLIAGGVALLLHTFIAASGFAVTSVRASEITGDRTSPADDNHAVQRQMSLIDHNIDASPLPEIRGDYVSLGYRGDWHRAQTPVVFVRAGVAAEQAAEADCSPSSIVYYAERAPENFDASRNGTLYGVRTHTSATRVGTTEGYNACALVVHAILKKAGCRWARYTANAKAIYDMAWKRGWRPSEVQKAACIVAWNSRTPGPKARIGRGAHRDKTKKKGVLYRHVGVTVGNWMSMDNTSYSGRPSAGITIRPIRYDAPMFLCPPENRSAQRKSKKSSRK